MKVITFDETCVGWSKIPECNVAYLQFQIDYLEDLLKFRGYLYMSSIYQTLGVMWNPEDKNICYLAEFGPIGIKFESIGNGKYLITIP